MQRAPATDHPLSNRAGQVLPLAYPSLELRIALLGTISSSLVRLEDERFFLKRVGAMVICQEDGVDGGFTWDGAAAAPVAATASFWMAASLTLGEQSDGWRWR